MSILKALVEGMAELGRNSYTQEEKDMIAKTRDIMRSHGQTEAAKALDAVIADFCKGVTTSSRSSRSTYDPDKRITPANTISSGYTSTEMRYMMKKEFNKAFKFDEYSETWEVNTMYAAIKSDGENIIVLIHPNEFSLKRGSYLGSITFSDGHVTNTTNKGGIAYKVEVEEAINKIINMMIGL